jgi:hypothetical protein
MSFDICLRTETGETVCVEHHSEGGTYQVGGTTEAKLNVTYNYSEVTKLVDFSFRDIHHKLAGDTIDQLREVVARLGTRRKYRDYWAPTPGNAGHAVAILLKWAEQHPDARWEVH